MRHQILRLLLLTVALCLAVPITLAQRPRPIRMTPAGGIPTNILLQIIRAEDTRQWNDELKKLLAHEDPKVRKRAVLAAGRIGNEAAVPVLAEMIMTDRDVDVRRMTAFALGEIEARGGAFALTQVLKKWPTDDGVVRARSVEALGKIVAATIAPNAAEKPDEEWLASVRAEIVGTLRFEDSRRPQPDRLTILLALTAVLRARPDGAGKLVAHFLAYADSRIVADALNTLARLRLKDGNDKARELLVKHNDPIVRANAARMLGAAEDKSAFDALLDRALHDYDSRVRVSAIRALASLKDPRAVQPLLERGDYLLKLSKVGREFSIEPRNELLEIATTLGRLLPNTNSKEAMDWLRELRIGHPGSPEIEVALARIGPQYYSVEAERLARDVSAEDSKLVIGKKQASAGQGLAELANVRGIADA